MSYWWASYKMCKYMKYAVLKITMTLGSSRRTSYALEFHNNSKGNDIFTQVFSYYKCSTGH